MSYFSLWFSSTFEHKYCIELFCLLHYFLTLLQTSWKYSPWLIHACISTVWQYTGYMICLLHDMCYFVRHKIYLRNIHEIFPCSFKHTVSAYFISKELNRKWLQIFITNWKTLTYVLKLYQVICKTNWKLFICLKEGGSC